MPLRDIAGVWRTLGATVGPAFDPWFDFLLPVWYGADNLSISIITLIIIITTLKIVREEPWLDAVEEALDVYKVALSLRELQSNWNSNYSQNNF